MVERRVTLVNPSGLHARPATQVVEFVQAYDGSVEVCYGDRIASLKSILMLLSMGLSQGTEIVLRVTGEGEEVFMDKLVDFMMDLEG